MSPRARVKELLVQAERAARIVNPSDRAPILQDWRRAVKRLEADDASIRALNLSLKSNTFASDHRKLAEWMSAGLGSERERNEELRKVSPERGIKPLKVNGSVDKESRSRRSVFVVHGRNQQIAEDLFAFLRSLDLHPVAWDEAVHFTGEGSPNISRILDRAFARAQVVIVLLTPDDEARLQKELWRKGDGAFEHRLCGQARPNVLFEAGMALGRHPDRTIILEWGRGLRPFSDISGRFTIRINDKVDWRHDLVNRLRAAKCELNTSSAHFLSVGAFKPGRAVARKRDGRPTKKSTS